MVAGKDHHIVDICVVDVVCNRFVNLYQPFVPVDPVLCNSLAQSGLEREVHHARKVAVKSVLVRVSGLPVGELRHVVGPDFADDVEMRIFFANALAPACHRVFLVVWIGIHAQTVEVGVFYPPYRPLLEILLDVRIVKVHVWHRGVEPAAFHIVLVNLGRIRAVLHRETAVAMGVLRPYVDPVLEWKVGHPPVCCAAVVWNYVHYHLYAFGVRVCNKLPVILVASEASVYVVIVRAGVSVI